MAWSDIEMHAAFASGMIERDTTLRAGAPGERAQLVLIDESTGEESSRPVNREFCEAWAESMRVRCPARSFEVRALNAL